MHTNGVFHLGPESKFVTAACVAESDALTALPCTKMMKCTQTIGWGTQHKVTNTAPACEEEELTALAC